MHDFDFLFGSWNVHNSRLKDRLVGSTTWIEFDALAQCRPILDGIGNVDEMVTSWDGGFRGMSLRLFDLARKEWSIYWASTRTGVLEPAVAGRFTDGIGMFEGRDSHLGTPVHVRFRWSDITPSSARWEQAFSSNDGVSWETNWRMQFARVAG